ncbi:MAG TPA: thioredoxin domain-containing protein [Firmicutes bacterium]|nr:thioredoxin domain-containing protein [Candidatus Fermentithermobacillaceae bacterium]
MSFTNRLIHEKSPYLLQHARNPVDWYPWCEEAFERAKALDRPVFLSIGYSTCHWCHVMARESFEDEEVAGILNRHYVAVKVDREERPDVDHVYMTVCRMLTGSGGWPLSVVMTPDKKPFWVGTYLPKRARYGLPGLVDVLNVLAEAWAKDREVLLGHAEKIAAALRRGVREAGFPEDDALRAGNREASHESALKQGFRHFHAAFDKEYGGFGAAPKFPSPHNLMFLLQYWKRTGEKRAFEMVDTTLKRIYAGGIYDHIGFGFFRYSTDSKWMVPHFEKMLYDNALMMMAFTDMAQATQKSFYREVVWEIASFLDREMKSPDGAFYTAIDAESEGEEGKYYLWTPGEVREVLDDDAERFLRTYGITDQGNFKGKSVPHLVVREKDGDLDVVLPPRSPAMERCRKRILARRDERVRPHTDDKILTSLNGIAAAALAKAARAFSDPDYLDMAQACLEFILERNVKDGELHARYRDGHVAYKAYLDDYAFLVWALIEMYQATFEDIYLKRAEKLAREMVDRFWDPDGKGFFLTAKDAEELIVRPKEVFDGAVPSGNSAAIMDILRLSHLLEAEDLGKLADEAISQMLPELMANPMAYSHLLSAVDYAAGGALDIRIAGRRDDPAVQAMISYVRRLYLPNGLVVLEDEIPKEGRPRAVICRQFTCGAPIYSVDELQVALMTGRPGG